jgi:endonuclease YncB( thermonuclease family)
VRRRRIFRPHREPRSWRGPLFVIAIIGIVGLLSGLGLPANLMGSAPREQDWSALASEVRIVDGETLRLGDRMLRLAGLDAPERGAACADPTGRAFDCGAAAAEALSRLVNDRSVLCVVQGRDRQGRGMGMCHAGGAELNAGLVGAGWALARDDNAALLRLEGEARRAGRGLWAAGFSRPEDWRRRN